MTPDGRVLSATWAFEHLAPELLACRVPDSFWGGRELCDLSLPAALLTPNITGKLSDIVELGQLSERSNSK
ncbi:hypothetical protein K402DRAFT_389092 [Aulographum hederae CBS 113979]|uniref:Uncharacterized protein n=1 Tax=Aulographum hederae CBS 113979 TaxID=1176131 RepID=A0A6G1HEP9_9PEZI|nr:hypothetical protein K402DRAFT_389092 [Aulographum hederae CBS 113979]